ncbi:transposase [Gudongella sp. DL1XJH-153]|uniref:transposase n=1 Tax=Gudongella sp. DL1XJH-153 TaxID=3409804 RepID=UPI003BB7D070
MARGPRIRSESGIYHVMLRGLDKRDIFLDDEDRIRFIEGMTKAKEKSEFILYGYCIMDNHIHILLKEAEDIGTIIKRITVGYIGWHNRKYERTGHLFQNRFRSEPVETEGYLLTVMRYIHQNPVKAGITKRPIEYKWSSYTDYEKIYRNVETIVDGELARSYFPTYKSFEEYMNTKNEDEVLEYKITVNQNDENLLNLIKEKYEIYDLDALSKTDRNKLILGIYSSENTSIRQLSRVFGVGKTVVEKAIKKDR